MRACHIAVLTLLGAGAAGCTVYEVPPPRPVAAVAPAFQPERATVEVEVFYGELASYGEWVERPAYGRVFLPAGVRAGWRPYTLGRWVHSDYGWTWVSEEPFGWATYHYGRWVDDPEVGWVWIPGREWGPAWVAWQHGGGYIGWAPLPPAVGFRAGVGLDLGGIDLRVAIAAPAYNFVEERRFLEPRIVEHCVPPARNVTIIHNTTNITNYTVINNRIVDQSIDVHRVEQATNQKVVNYTITEQKPGDRQRTARIEGDQIALYHPAAPRPTRATPAKTEDRGTATPRVQAAGGRAAASQPPRTGQTPQPEELDRRHTAETRALEDHHAAERQRLADLHQNDLKAPQAPQNADDLKRRHQEELQALNEQHQREKQQLEARHQRERERAAQAAAEGNKPKKAEKKEPGKKDGKKEEDKDKAKERPPS